MDSIQHNVQLKNINTSAQKKSAKKMYVTLKDGRVVPVKTPLLPTNSQAQKHAPNNRKTINKETPIRIVKSVSLSPKYKKTHSESTLNPKPETLQGSLVLEPKGASSLGPNKKFKKASSYSNAHGVEFMDQEFECEVIDNEVDFHNSLPVDSSENECTTPQYLDNETLEEGNMDDNDDCLTMQSEEGYNTAVPDDICDEDIYDKIIAKSAQSLKHSSVDNKSKNSQSNVRLQNAPIGGSQSKTVNSQQKIIHTPETTVQNKFGKVGVSYRATPRTNDKLPDLPIPANINQYGDCLKTRLGRYHYGLTLSDPPCQFFRGVLKGASGQTLAVMFGDANLISKIEEVLSKDEIGNFAMDTTFRVIPTSTTGVNHVLTISLLFQHQIFPLWYAVLSFSSAELYKRIIIEFQQYVLDWPFNSILLDNDPALCKAVRAVFPDIELYGSWFHYCCSVWKELGLNNLVEQCQSDSKLMTAVKMLLVIPYLPPLDETPSSITMVEGFEVIRNFAAQNNLPSDFSKVLDYVAAFWFNRVKSKNVTVFGKQTSALNYLEILQLSLLSFMKPNGNIWTLNHSFQSVSRTANTELNRYLSGKRLKTKKSRAKKFNVPIRQNMKRLLLGTYNVKTYLEKSTIYCEEMLDIFLHPLYPRTTSEKSNYTHTEGWKLKIINT